MQLRGSRVEGDGEVFSLCSWQSDTTDLDRLMVFCKAALYFPLLVLKFPSFRYVIFLFSIAEVLVLSIGCILLHKPVILSWKDKWILFFPLFLGDSPILWVVRLHLLACQSVTRTCLLQSKTCYLLGPVADL